MRFLNLSGVWAIEPTAARSYLQTYEAILARRESGAPQNAVEARGSVADIRSVESQNGVASINVRGPIVPHADLINEVSGIVSVEGIRAQLNAALQDESVKSIILSMDSPGGQTTGISELAHFVRAVDAQKPVIAFVEGSCCSAANWIAAGARERVISKTGLMGSIGCMVAWTDDRQLKEAVGLQDIEFISSQSPLKNPDPLSDEGKSEYQRLVDENAAAFISDMAALYGVPVATVKSDFGRGGIFTGKSAVKAGLADRVGSFEQIVAELSKGKFKQKTNGATRANGGKGMTVGEFLKSPLSAFGGNEPVDVQEGVLDAEGDTKELRRQVQLADLTRHGSQAAPNAPLTIAGMTEAEVVAMKEQNATNQSVIEAGRKDAAQAFAQTHASRYLENGAGDEQSDRAKFVDAVSVLHLKAATGEKVSPEELEAVFAIPVAEAVVSVGVLDEGDLEGATAHKTETNKPTMAGAGVKAVREGQKSVIQNLKGGKVAANNKGE